LTAIISWQDGENMEILFTSHMEHEYQCPMWPWWSQNTRERNKNYIRLSKNIKGNFVTSFYKIIKLLLEYILIFSAFAVLFNAPSVTVCNLLDFTIKCFRLGLSPSLRRFFQWMILHPNTLKKHSSVVSDTMTDMMCHFTPLHCQRQPTTCILNTTRP
jgi:hypothetical protein